MRWLLLSVALLAIGNFLVLWFDSWLELLGVFVVMAAVAVAGYSPTWRIIHTDLVIEDKKQVDPKRAQR
jgi:MFS family permease